MASPVAVRMAGELGIDLRQVKGTGPMGRIIKRDIETYIQERDKAPKAAPPPPMPTPSYEPSGAEYTVEPFSGIRQTIGKRMTESKQNAPHFYVTMDIDMGAAMALRSQLNALRARDGQDLGQRPGSEGVRGGAAPVPEDQRLVVAGGHAHPEPGEHRARSGARERAGDRRGA